MLDDAIELLTKMMIQEDFENKKKKQEPMITMSKTDLYKFCVKLLKLIKNEMED